MEENKELLDIMEVFNKYTYEEKREKVTQDDLKNAVELQQCNNPRSNPFFFKFSTT